MTTLSKLYYTESNAASPDTSTSLRVMQSMLWGLKAMLLGQLLGTTGTSGAPPAGALWSHYASCDGAAVSTNPAVDLWTAAFDASKLIRAAAGVAHSWIVLKSPAAITALGVPFYLLISLGTGTDARIQLGLAKTAFAGGTTTDDPTSANSVLGPETGNQFAVSDVTAGVAHRFSLYTDANGDFVMTFARNAVGWPHTIFAVKALTGPNAGDLYPICLIIETKITSRGVLDSAGGTSNTMVATGWDGSQGLNIRSGGGTLIPQTSAGTRIMSPDATWFSRTAVNEQTTLQDALTCFVNFHGSAGVLGVRGTIADWFLTNNTRAVGSCEPTAGATEHTLVGNIWMPNGGVAPIY